MRTRLVWAVLLLVGCGSGTTTDLAITSIEPAFGPLAGGTRIVINGSGFQAAGAAPNRVIFGDREAPLAAAIDDSTLEVIVPPGEDPGPVKIIVFNDNGNVSIDNTFRYSTQPEITAVSPDLLRYDQGGMVTVTGTGFMDDDAGAVSVLVDGKKALDLEVVSDTQLKFVAPAGKIFTRANIVIENRRGTGEFRGYQYGPGPQGGLVLFPNNNSQTFLVFFDPLTLEIIDVLRRDPTSPLHRGWRTVFRDEQNRFIGLDHADDTLYQMDLVDQKFTKIASTLHATSIVKIGTTFYVVEKRDNQRFGTINPMTGAFTQIGGALPAGLNGVSMAADGAGILYQTRNSTIQTINRTTGVAGAAVTMAPSARVSAMAFLGTTLFGFNRNQNSLITINPTTGVTDAVLANVGFSIAAIQAVP